MGKEKNIVIGGLTLARIQQDMPLPIISTNYVSFMEMMHGEVMYLIPQHCAMNVEGFVLQDEDQIAANRE